MEHTNFQNGRILKRRSRMQEETQNQNCGSEVRRLHILYFLSRNGLNEDPHLIRIHHLSKNGVRLRDIKRWLRELRGKDMPESFSWSYKRKYKTGYVWQDILDDELVTPISDNEFVLKGSQISSTKHNIDFSRIPSKKEQKATQESTEDDDQRASSEDVENAMHSPKTASSAQESSSFGSETSTLTDDSVEKSSDITNQEEASLNEKERKTNKLEMVIINAKTSISESKTADTSNNKTHHRKSQSSAMFRNFISCGGGVDTNDSVVYKPFLKTCSNDSADEVRDSANRVTPAAYKYKPLYGPKCSQCGKTFIPEKMHSHMKSCKGMKALARGSNHAVSAAENISKKTTTSRKEDSVSTYLLTQNF